MFVKVYFLRPMREDRLVFLDDPQTVKNRIPDDRKKRIKILVSVHGGYKKQPIEINRFLIL